MVNISTRLKRLKVLANQHQEVSSEECVSLWIKYIGLMIDSGLDQTLEIEEYFRPPFHSVSLDDYRRAKKEIEEFEQGQIN